MWHSKLRLFRLQGDTCTCIALTASYLSAEHHELIGHMCSEMIIFLPVDPHAVHRQQSDMLVSSTLDAAHVNYSALVSGRTSLQALLSAHALMKQACYDYCLLVCRSAAKPYLSKMFDPCQEAIDAELLPSGSSDSKVSHG